ncbi:MAG: mechanosensitive ion channel [Sulfurimicrobium sp.]|jgi:small-conductance mechanosensitive channel|nr:mechanosensitive ion channel [Sulfurimicrobium sp.]MDP2200097.1 mechanosensitive ion channel [Sulfurimicrobium sp.]MDP2963808.1 mechanosensitive ion channel [Sulfurimicrobium sp.]MDP3688597.1 mechanosensitive ion channel [Sulfurimicrobium sp.]MDZ7656888.1 mechanosensitive ion channel [Sulfurimicrobium sp.]
MQNTQEIHNLLLELLNDLGQTAMLWQIATLALCLGLAWLVTRLIRKQIPAQEGAWKLGMGGVDRIIFPLTALLLVLVAKTLLNHWHSISVLNLAVPLLLSLALVRFTVYMLRHIFTPGGWVQTSERFISVLIWSGVALHITGFLPEILEVLEDFSFSIGKQKVSLLMILSGLLSIAVTLLVVMWLASTLEKRLMAVDRLDMSLRVVLTKLIRAGLILLGILIALPIAGIDITVLSVFGGALGVGIGFGLQKIASNYISGFIILLDRSIRIGDLVTVENRYGTVTSITSRYVVVKGLDGTEAIIPNEALITSTVLNHSYTNHEVRISIPIQVSYDSPLDKATQIMLKAANNQPRVLKEPEPKAFLKNFGESGIDLEMSIWINDPEEGQLNLRSDINWEIWQGFQQAGIEIPFPQRVVKLLQ